MKTSRSLFLMTIFTAPLFVQIAAADHTVTVQMGRHVLVIEPSVEPSVEPLTCEAIQDDALFLGCDFSGLDVCLVSDPIPEPDPSLGESCVSDDSSFPAFISNVAVGARPLPDPDVLIRATCGQGQLSAVISQAKAEAQTGRNVRVVLPPCIYREQLNISDVHLGSIDIVAEVPGTAFISGADVFVGWTQSDGIWSTAWTFDFGLRWPSQWPSSLPQDELLKRIETFFVNGVRLNQVSSFAELKDESFFIDELQNEVFIKSAIDLNTAFVEGTVRQTAIRISKTENIAIRGVRVLYSASEVQRIAAVWISNSSDILLEDMEIRDNSGIGLNIILSEFITTRGIRFLDNGYNGYTAWRVIKLLSENDTVSGSNWRGFPFGYIGWHVAGFKHFSIHDAVYWRLTATANLTRGFWLDTDIADVVIENNRWCGNSTQGAFLEKIQGPLLIRGLTTCDNADRGITVSAAQNITIEDSQLSNNVRAQIHFGGNGTVNVTDFETGEQFVVSTDFWVVTNSNLSASGNDTILSGSLLPPNFTVSENNCSTENPTGLDSVICQ